MNTVHQARESDSVEHVTNRAPDSSFVKDLKFNRVTTSTGIRETSGDNLNGPSQSGKMVLSWSEFTKSNCGSKASCELRCAKRCAGSRSARPHPDSLGAEGSASSRRAPENQGPALDAGLSLYRYGVSHYQCARATYYRGQNRTVPEDHFWTVGNPVIHSFYFRLRNRGKRWEVPGKMVGKNQCLTHHCKMTALPRSLPSPLASITHFLILHITVISRNGTFKPSPTKQ